MNKAQLEIKIEKLEENIQKIKEEFKEYKYQIIDLRNNCYGLGIYLVNTFSKYFQYGFVTNIKEALSIRKYNQDFPILIKEEVIGEEVYDVINNNFTLTINNLNYLQDLSDLKIKDDLKLHLFIDNGSNLIGLKTLDEVKKAIEIINSHKHLILEGIYTEINSYGCDNEVYYEALSKFLKIIEPISNKDLIIHVNEPIMYHAKVDAITGIKFDLAPLGLCQNFNKCSNLKKNKLLKKYGLRGFRDCNIDVDLSWALTAGIKTISFVEKGTIIGKNYLAKENMRVALLNIGHKDGITKALKVVVINNEICDILADNVDELIVKISDNISLDDKAYIISEYNNIDNVLLNLKTNRYYLMSILNNDLPRVYLEDDREEKIDY